MSNALPPLFPPPFSTCFTQIPLVLAALFVIIVKNESFIYNSPKVTTRGCINTLLLQGGAGMRNLVFFFRTLLILFVITVHLPASVSADNKIRIGVSLGLTGRFSPMAAMQEKGFRLWEKDVNNRGGILGRKVELVIYNDNSDPQTAAGHYKKLILQDKVDLLFGPISTGITAAVLPITEKHGYPLLITGAASDTLWQQGYRGAFGVYTPASKFSVGFLEMIAMEGFMKVAIASANDGFSRSTAGGTKKWGERFGLEIVFYEEFEKGSKDLDEIATSAKFSGAQVLIVAGHLAESVQMKKSLKRIGWSPDIYYSSIGPALSSFRELLGEDADKSFSSSQWESGCAFCPPELIDFKTSFEAAYKKAPSYHAAAAFAGGQIFESVLRGTKKIDNDKIRNLLYSSDINTALGRYGVDKTGKQLRHFPLIVQWQKGQKEIVWPKNLRTAKPVF